MPPFKDEHVLIIAPGSRITAAQLGLPESFTPPKFRFPTRMFPGEKPGEWEATRVGGKVEKIQKTVEQPNGAPAVTNGESAPPAAPPAPAATETEPPTNGEHPPAPDVDMADAPATAAAADTAAAVAAATADAPASESVPPADPQAQTQPDPASEAPKDEPVEDETVTTFMDDLTSVADAVYPIIDGRIENWPCFFALLTHIYNMLSPPFHMPVLFIAQPCWSLKDQEMITQYVFEQWRIPAFCMMDAAVSACYAYGVPSALVLDVGYGKCDVTAVTEFMVNDVGRGAGIVGCGGYAMTQRLLQVLAKDGFTEEMAEQLKRSPICEILPAGMALPTATEAINPAAAASTGALDSGANAITGEGFRPGQVPRGPGLGTAIGEENGDGDENDEGVLDVAAIVARDNAAEVLAKREKEKAEKAAAKKGGAVDQSRQMRLRNSERSRASFQFVEDSAEAGLDVGEGPRKKRKREIEVGVERFLAATPRPDQPEGLIDTIADALHRAVLSVPDVPSRAGLWENLIILGNGSRIRGFVPSLLATLAARYTLSPSTATIFTSELPSNFTTPVPTPGNVTPNPSHPSHPSHHPTPAGVNPLLVAATKNMMANPSHASPHHLGIPGAMQSHFGQQLHLPPSAASGGLDPNASMLSSHRGFGQSPTAIKLVKTPDYFPEWKAADVSGMEEASFLGAQVAAKVVFIVDGGVSKGFMTRVEYNEEGPSGITGVGFG